MERHGSAITKFRVLGNMETASGLIISRLVEKTSMTSLRDTAQQSQVRRCAQEHLASGKLTQKYTIKVSMIQA